MALIKGLDDESIQSVGHLGIVAGAYDSLGIAKVIERTIPKTRHHNLSLAQKNLIPVRYHKRKDGCVFPVEITENMVRMKERDVIEKFLLGDSVMFHQPLFSEGPESFNTIIRSCRSMMSTMASGLVLHRSRISSRLTDIYV